jgi:phosphate transport system substrate-binding protein
MRLYASLATLLAAVLVLATTFALIRQGTANALDLGEQPSHNDPEETARPQKLQWVGCDICKASFMDAVAEAFREKTGTVIEVEQAGATRGIRDVLSHKADMGGCCRPCLNIPEEQGVKLIPVAWDALVVVVHHLNPLSDIRIEQLQRIFTGQITNWQDLGGPDRELQLLARRGKHSGVGAGTRLLIFGNLVQDYTPRARLFRSTGPLEDALEETPDGIAVTGISSARLRPKLKTLAVEGKLPTRENVINGQYLFYRPLFLTVPDNPHPAVLDFVEFLFSPEGQMIIARTETVTLAEGKELWGKYKEQMQRVLARAP